MVGAAPLSRLVVVVALLCDSALASCFCCGEGLTAAAFAVFASAGDGAGFFAAVVVCAGLAGAAGDFAFAGSAGGGGALFSPLCSQKTLEKNPPPSPPGTPPRRNRGGRGGVLVLALRSKQTAKKPARPSRRGNLHRRTRCGGRFRLG